MTGSVMKNVVELSFCIMDIILLYRFGRVILETKSANKMFKLSVSTATAILIYIMTPIPYYSEMVTTVLLLLCISYVLVIFEGKVYLRIGIALLYFIILGVLTSTIISLFVLFSSVRSNDMLQNISIRLGIALIIKLTFFLLIEIARYFFAGKSKNTFIESSSIHLFFILTFLVLLFLFDDLLTEGNSLSKNAINYIMLAFGFSFIFMNFLIFQHYRNRERLSEYQFLLDEANLKQEADMKSTEHAITIMNTKHDLKNHLGILKYLLEKDKKEDAVDYIKSIYELDAFKTFVNSKNETINALLNTKISQHKDIRFKVHLNINEFPFEARYLTVLLGNTIDNAVDAVQCLPEDKRKIEVTISENNQFGKIVISNFYAGKIKSINGILLSKKRQNRRGLGLISVHQVLEECNGTMDYSMDNNEFHIRMLLKKF